MEANTCRKPHPTDISDEAWEWIAPLLAQRPGPGRKRTVAIREIVNAIFYLDKTGCQWEMLPHEGVTYFLTAEGVDSTLTFIANHSAPDSARCWARVRGSGP
jgi:Putative transposase of IS4/5 family (DUF4096)